MYLEKNEWFKLVKDYKDPNIYDTVFNSITSFIPAILTWYLAYLFLEKSLLITFIFMVLCVLFRARVFSILHDCVHSTFYKSNVSRDFFGFIAGIITLTPYKCWKKIHLTHHASSSNLAKRDVGDFLMVTVDEYKKMSEKEKKMYRINRHPIIVLLIAPIIYFFILNRMVANNPVFNMSKEEKNSVYLSNLAIILTWGAISFFIGFKAFLMIELPIALMMASLGFWAFYIQHQFENTYWAENEKYDYYLAAMKGSSFLNVPQLLHWFLGYTGYHHIHHLCPQIPNYNLKKCHDKNKEFQDAPAITFWKSFDVFKYNLWDSEKNKMVKYSDI